MQSLTETRDDAELMRRVSLGDREAFHSIVRRHQDRVLGLAARFASPSEAEDIAQEVFLSVYRSASRFRGDATFQTWLYRIVVNTCLNWKRRAKAVPFPDNAEPQAPEEDLSDIALRVREAIARLPDRQRVAVLLHRFEGMSYRQVAEAMGLSEEAVESLLARAYRALRRMVGI